ncbi:MAG: hypothetical protein H0U71_09680 [Gammaproteobacteria bacterium]|nr:hypothetical protein [Gammaproteobacteria bacterium]
MMFLSHTAFALEVIALAIGISMLIWSKTANNNLAKTFGYIIAILAVVGMLCPLYYAFKYWEDGYFGTPWGQMENRSGMSENEQDGSSNDESLKVT